MQALIRKARDVGKLSERGYRYYNFEISRRGMKRNEAGEITELIEQPLLFKRLLNSQLTNLSYNAEELSILFGLSVKELQSEYLPTGPKLRIVA